MGARTDRRSKFGLGAVLYGLLLSLIGILAISLVAGIVMTAVNSDAIPRTMAAIHYVVIALGGFVAAGRAKQSGWLHGATVGLLFTVVMAVLFPPAEVGIVLLHPATIAHIGAGMICGALGGILGVSSNNR